MKIGNATSLNNDQTMSKNLKNNTGEFSGID